MSEKDNVKATLGKHKRRKGWKFWTILIGGIVYRWVDGRSRARGDSDDTRQSVIHRGLLFCSGLVAGEAIMGILIAVLVMLQFDMPILGAWSEGGLLVDIVSLIGLFGVIGVFAYKAIGNREVERSTS